MTNEEREAIERLRKYNGKPLPTGEYQSAGHWHAVNLAVGVALREHPADNDELITEEWIKSLGWKAEGSSEYACYSWRHERHLIEWFVDDMSLWLNTSCIIDNATRGDVRRLCVALRYEIKAKVTA